MSTNKRLTLTDGDRISLGIVFAAALALSGGVGHMFLSAWDSGAWRPLHAIFIGVGVDPVLATQFIAMVLTGWFLGLVGLMYNDRRKQVQSTLLASTPFIAVGVMVQSGYASFIFESIFLNIIGIVVGGIISVGVVGYLGDLDGFNRNRSKFGQAVDLQGNPLRFKNTTNVIKFTMYGVIGIGLLIDVMLNFGSQPRWTVVHSISSGGFYLLMETFINTDVTSGDTYSSSNFELLGPRQSGKTYATLGLYLAAHEADNVNIFDSNPNMNKFVIGQNPTPQDQENGYVDFQKSGNELGDIDEYEFDLVVERGQPKTVKVRTVDYRGENLPDVANEVAFSTDGGTNNKKSDGSEDSSEAKSGGSTEERIEVSNDILDREESLDLDSENDASSTPIEDGISSESDNVDSAEPGEGSNGDQDTDRTYENVIDETDEILTKDSEDTSGSEVDKNDDDDLDEILEDTDSDGERENENREVADSEDEGDIDQLQQLREKVGGNVKDSDKLIMILDMGRFMGETTQELSEDLGTAPMIKIKKALPDKKFIFIATKADHFIEEWREREDYQGVPSRNKTRWRSFQETLSKELRNDPRISPLMDGGLVYPVYYEVNEDGYIRLDDEGKIKHQGFNDLLDVLVR